VRAPLGRGAVIGDQHDDRVLQLAQLPEVAHKTADLRIGVREEPGVHLHHARVDALLIGRKRIPGLDPGEAEVLAVSIARSLPAVIFERRARRVAGALGAGLIDVIELIVRGTTGRALREERIVRFARMVDMRLDDAVELLARVRSTSLG